MEELCSHAKEHKAKNDTLIKKNISEYQLKLQLGFLQQKFIHSKVRSFYSSS